MKDWLYWALIGTLIFTLFIVLPINYSGNKSQKQLLSMYDNYIEKFNKSYKNNPAEYETRFQHFLASLEEIDRLNAQSHGPEQQRARFGLTKLSDMSKAEYQEIHLSDEKLTKPPHSYGRRWSAPAEPTLYNHDNHHHKHENIFINTRKKRALLPLQVDWRAKGVIGPVRNQGVCGACWAFSTIGTMETMAAIKTGKLEQLSVQEVIDCAGLGNSGCLGGDICLLLDWLQLTKAVVMKDKEYPLQLTNTACKLKKNATGVQLATFTCNDFVGAEDKILQALATHGPVAVAVNALTWQNYLGGVIQYHCSGALTDLNHAVELVGYDMTGDVPYYIAKNSWGSEFGNSGYLHLAVGSNICGIAHEVATVDVV